MKKELTREQIEELTIKIKQGTATEAERLDFDTWYSRQAERTFHVPENLATSERALKDTIYQHIEQELGFNKSSRSRIVLWRRVAVAASILVFLSAGLYFAFDNPSPAVQSVAAMKEDFAPGSNKAILTLSGGRRIILTDAKNGQLAKQGNTVINKTADGKVVYGSGAGEASIAINTMSTPRGGQYHLTLADGTDVWLNAASSITYPAAFTGKNREVEITGEVYFQVAHNAAKPFRVKSKDQMVEVLGTHFNINAYENEASTKTTLLEGSVALSSSDQRILIKPGEQSVFNKNRFVVTDADVKEAVAWKNGYFHFVDTDIQTLMRQISRWYDVDVEFVGPISKDTFTGRISRFRNISQVLKIVKSSDVQLTFEGRRIMVSM
ncbi:FecR family protein [Mucilaginibacter pineti]|uniref:FecR family protein n=1 Tax=Mucilaginibacter pineti TaxID=1391627 RepID=A0A1G7ES31_9SPHI|nr:FecR family protein [Mucilaginibacter pineti]SDE66474.1 FecR family protein [Mucilaginibacter pineti]